MGSLDRSKRKVQLWKKAVVHFALCFVMGFFTGFAPTAKTSLFPTAHNSSHPHRPLLRQQSTTPQPHIPSNLNRTLVASTPVGTPARSQELTGLQTPNDQEVAEENTIEPRRLIILVTPTSTKDKYQGVFLRRLANTIKLVPPPLLWIVVEGQSESNEVSEILRKTGIMYRHLVFKENFTDTEAELDHQRNIALKHIEHHRLSGIVHFSGLSNVYDLLFFEELREIEMFGTWPMALVAANKKEVTIEGPVCDSSQVIGWHLKRMNNSIIDIETDAANTKPPIHISSFGFNSSILWDPERWGRPSSVQQTSQNPVKFVKQVAREDETKLKGFPPEECSQIMLWRLEFPSQEVSSPVSETLIATLNTNQR